jgi:hypothetical protein
MVGSYCPEYLGGTTCPSSDVNFPLNRLVVENQTSTVFLFFDIIYLYILCACTNTDLIIFSFPTD